MVWLITTTGGGAGAVALVQEAAFNQARANRLEIATG